MTASTENRSVLIVDDDKGTRKSIGRYLGARGITCFTAEDGAHALESIETHHPDIVLLDIMMPGLNGTEVAKRVDTLEPRPKIILMSGYPDAMAEATKAKLQVFRTIWKPVPLKQLGKFLDIAAAFGDDGSAPVAASR